MKKSISIKRKQNIHSRATDPNAIAGTHSIGHTTTYIFTITIYYLHVVEIFDFEDIRSLHPFRSVFEPAEGSLSAKRWKTKCAYKLQS
jgi:hypothetical protein